jgi:hypothetical protein
MALIPDVIKANEVLKDLSDDQVTAIATLSANDENSVISAKVGELHGGYDKDIKEISGVEKNQGEKSYDYAKRVLGEFKTKAESTSALTEEITTHKTKISELEKAIADGKGNEAMAQKLKDEEAKLTALQTQYDTDKETWEKEKDKHSAELSDIKVDSQFDKVTPELKFKAGYPESVQKTLIKSTKEGILTTLKPDWVDGKDGEKVMVYRDADGEIKRNPSNKQEPYTTEELIRENLKDVLDPGRKVRGADTDDPGKTETKVDLVDLANAKTQVEADDIIDGHLMQLGVLRGSTEFAEQKTKIRKDSEVDKLPIR